MHSVTLGQIERRCHVEKARKRWWYHIHRRFALPITWLAYRCHLTPNTVSAAMVVFGLAGAAALVSLNGWWNAAGIALLYLGFLLDKVDGDLARLQGTTSPRGLILDYAYHRLTLFSFYAALGGHAYLASGSATALVAGFVAGFLANYVQDAQVYPYRLFAQKVLCGNESWSLDAVGPQWRREGREKFLRPLKIFTSQLLLLPMTAIALAAGYLETFLLLSAGALLVYLIVQHGILLRRGLEAELAHIEACRRKMSGESADWQRDSEAER